MKDIDFDELDRAVNSVLSSDEPVAVAPESAEEPAPEAPVESSTSTLPSPAERRRKGRFMDVVHPSSDMRMRTGKGSTSGPRVVSGVPLVTMPQESAAEPEVAPVEETTRLEETVVAPEPVAKVVIAPTEALEPYEPTLLATPDTLTVDDVVDNTTFDDEPDDEGSDPARVHGAEEAEADVLAVLDAENPDALSDHTVGDILDAMPSEGADDDATPDETEVDDHLEVDEPTPLESPFVSVPVVQKRPLGAYSDAPSLDEPAEEPASVSLDEPLTVPEEDELPPEEIDAMAKLETEEVAPGDAAEEPAPDDEAPEATPEEAEPEEPPIQSSIPMQYKEKASSTSDETTPIYDTSDYHKPLQHTPDKGADWRTVAVIAALVLVGAGAGFAFYFFDPLVMF